MASLISPAVTPLLNAFLTEEEQISLFLGRLRYAPCASAIALASL